MVRYFTCKCGKKFLVSDIEKHVLEEHFGMN